MIMMMMNAERNGRNSDADVILCNWIIAMIMQLKKKTIGISSLSSLSFFSTLFSTNTHAKKTK